MKKKINYTYSDVKISLPIPIFDKKSYSKSIGLLYTNFFYYVKFKLKKKNYKF